jgi:hypothetical protein
MRQCFRAVKEIWSLHSSCFIEPKALITLLHDLAARGEHSERRTQLWRTHGGLVRGWQKSSRLSSLRSSVQCRKLQRQSGRARCARGAGCAYSARRQYAESIGELARFDWRARRIRFLHRQLLRGSLHERIPRKMARQHLRLSSSPIS